MPNKNTLNIPQSYSKRMYGVVLSLYTLLMTVLVIITNNQSSPEVQGISLRNETNSEIGYVTEVVDGDTIKVNINNELYTVRLIGINTPETKHPQTGIECFGIEAEQYAKEILLNKEITLESDVSNTDRYGRLLRYIFIDNEFINETLVSEGYAFATAYEPDVKYQNILDSAQIEARENNNGLWSQETCNGSL